MNATNRLMLVFCGTNHIVGIACQESGRSYSVARILLLVFCGTRPIGEPASQQASQPASRQPASQPVHLYAAHSNAFGDGALSAELSLVISLAHSKYIHMSSPFGTGSN